MDNGAGNSRANRYIDKGFLSVSTRSLPFRKSRNIDIIIDYYSARFRITPEAVVKLETAPKVSYFGKRQSRFPGLPYQVLQRQSLRYPL